MKFIYIVPLIDNVNIIFTVYQKFLRTKFKQDIAYE